MSILSTDRGWKSDREIIKVSALKLRGQTHSHNLWLLLVLQHIKLISVNDDFVSHLFARNYWLLQNSTFLFSNEPAISIDLMPLFSDFKYLSLALGLLTSVCVFSSSTQWFFFLKVVLQGTKSYKIIKVVLWSNFYPLIFWV